ncbi:MAG: hypothetical protein ACYTFZ_07205, partial [Planctomycetota bacterium]
MKCIRWLTLVAAAALALLVWACRTAPRGVRAVPEAPEPVLELAGQSQARRVVDWSSLPPGPGAEGRLGDFLLENACAKFTIAGADHPGPGPLAGNLIDAAVQGCEDRMRLLVPLLGSEPATRPLCTAVKIQSAGGLQVPAVVVAEGHLVREPSVKVQTTYQLEPGSHSLQITTTVENRGEAMLTLFGFSDLLYHGRTLRYAPGAGLGPLDKRSSSTWVSFFWQNCAWGVVCSPLDTIEGIHKAGVSELRYAVVDIPPGQSRMYRRSVVAATGGPERVWQTAYPLREDALSRLGVGLTERDTGTPVPNGEVLIRPDDRRSPVLLVTGSEGEAQMDLHAGRYFVAAAAAGRVPAAAATVNCASGQRHHLGTPLSPAALAKVRVRAKIGEFFTPAAARLSCYLPGRPTEPFPLPRPFPLAGRSGVVLADGTAGTLLPLAPQSLDLPSRCFIIAYGGPLFDCAIVPVPAVPGRTVPVDISLQRQVDPGQYLALDLRQHSDTSLDCALTLEERKLANACEGLDAAVLSDPALEEIAPDLSAWAECCLMRGLRLELDRVGSFSVYPIEAGGDWEDELSRAAQPGQPIEDVLTRVRELFPDAVIQLDQPLDERFGYLTVCGLGSAGAGAPP